MRINPFPLHPTSRRALRAVTVASAVVALVAWSAHQGGYRWNSTDSLPRGLWRITPVSEVQVGEIAYFCPPATREITLALDRGYIASGPCVSGTVPLFKRLAARPGDVVLITPQGLAVNGGPVMPNTAALCADGEQRPLPVIPPGAYTVSQGEGWFLSDYTPYSYDSRYFGPLPMRLARARAEPVWTYDR